jgi:putative ABC transport system ATP-binding protein
LINLENLQRFFEIGDDCVKAVNDMNLRIEAGEFVAIMGPSGSGKSTLLYVIGAMDRPTKGTITINKKNLERMNDKERSEFRNRTLGFVFQSFHLLSRLDLIRNAEIPMIYRGVAPEKRRERAKTLLKAVGLADRMDRRPTELSGGQCQRAAIARALVNRPLILLADEPTGNLDSKTGEEIIALFQALNRAGMTVIMVTHDNRMAQHAQRIVRMKDGRLENIEQVQKPLQSFLPADIEASLKEVVSETF